MATIKDVARLAGVGVGTASRVVSGKGAVSSATAERVRDAIRTLDFRPSHTARSLLSGSSQMIGVYIPVLKGTFFTPILALIDAELRINGRHMVVAFGSGEGDQREQAIEGIEFLLERGCDGLIAMSNVLRDEDIAVLGPKQSYLAVTNHSLASIADQCFPINHRQAGVLAAQALLEHQHKAIAVIAGPQNASDNVERVAGFMDELKRCGIETDEVPVLDGDFSPEGGWSCARALVDSGQHITAVFCANDEMAVGALSYFQKVGISVPKDISVLGYDDTPSAEYSAPRLTSVHLPWKEMTQSSIHWLLNRCYGTKFPLTKDFPMSVKWRDSVGIAADIKNQIHGVPKKHVKSRKQS